MLLLRSHGVDVARLLIDNQLVTRSEGGFADPLPLLLFERTERVPSGLRTDVASATRRLTAVGASAEHIDRFVRAVHQHAALAPQALLGRPEIAWSGLSADALLRYETRRTATGFTAQPEHLLDTLLASALVDDPDDLRATRRQLDDARTAIAVLALASVCLRAADTAEVHYDVSELVGEDDLDAWLDELWASRPEPTHVRDAVVELVEGVESLAAVVARDDAPADPAAAAHAIETATSAGRLDQAADLLAAALTRWHTLHRDPGLEAATDALVRAALDAGAPELARAALAPWLYRAPGDAAAHLRRVSLEHTVVIEKLAPTLVDALSIQRAPLGADATTVERWRAEAVDLALALVDAGHLGGGLAVLRKVCDVDATGAADDPVRPLVDRLRRALRDRYGLPHAHARDAESARFLCTDRGAETDPAVDLVRLLHDAVVGALHESQIADETRRETFFESHIAPGLTWLEHDPKPGGGRQHLPRARNDDSGPGLGLALAFLLGLAGLIALIGYLVVTYAA